MVGGTGNENQWATLYLPFEKEVTNHTKGLNI